MFSYEKFLQRPIKIRNKNPQLASLIATQYGGAYCKSLSTFLYALKAYGCAIFWEVIQLFFVKKL